MTRLFHLTLMQNTNQLVELRLHEGCHVMSMAILFGLKRWIDANSLSVMILENFKHF